MLCEFVKVNRWDVVKLYDAGKCKKIANIEDIRKLGDEIARFWEMDMDYDSSDIDVDMD